MRKIVTCLLAVTALVLFSAPAQAVDFYLHNTLDLSNSNFFPTPLFDGDSPYGTNPSAVTYDGSNLWVAGFVNGPTTTGTSGIVKIADPWGTPSATGLNTVATPGSRGYSGLAYHGASSTVLAAFDNGGASADGITAWNALTDANKWSVNGRGGGGIAYDTGFGGADMGAGWINVFGSGRRSLNDINTGAKIYDSTDGMIVNGAGTGNFFRDIDFAPNGDIWLREGNQVIRGVRSGGNSLSSTTTMVAGLTDGDFTNGQNIKYLDGLTGGDQLIYNDRPTASPGQFFFFNVKLINPDGSASTSQFLAGNGDSLGLFAEGAGYYDFTWDAASEALVILDFNNRLVYQFRTFEVPEPASLALLALGGVVVLRRRR